MITLSGRVGSLGSHSAFGRVRLAQTKTKGRNDVMVPTLSEDERSIATNGARSDLKWIMAEAEVPNEVQASIYHLGFTKVRVFAGLGVD